MKYKLLVAALVLFSFNAQAQTFNWTEGDGTTSIPAASLDGFGQTAGHLEINYTPGTIYTTGVSQQILDIPNHLGVWIWNDGIHGQWYSRTGEPRLRSSFRL